MTKTFFAISSRYLTFYVLVHLVLFFISMFSQQLHDLPYHHLESSVSDMLLYGIPFIFAFSSFGVPHAYFNSLPHRILTVIYIMICGIVLIGCKAYWGYYLSRPSIPNPVRNGSELVSVASFQTSEKQSCNLVPRDKTWLPGSTYRYYYDFTSERIAYFLDDIKMYVDRNKFHWREAIARPEFQRHSTKALRLHQYITQNIDFEAPESGYGPCRFAVVDIFEFSDKHGQQTFFAAYSTAQLSNDHYATYEFALSGGELAGYKIMAQTKFYHDVAGVEGLEFPIIMVLFNFLYGLTSVVVATQNSRQNA